MTGDETLSAQLDRLRESYDDAIEALAEQFGLMWTEMHPRDATAQGVWPRLSIDATPEGTITFQGFHFEFRTCVPLDCRGAFLAAAIAHLDAYPRHAYDWQAIPETDN